MSESLDGPDTENAKTPELAGADEELLCGANAPSGARGTQTDALNPCGNARSQDSDAYLMHSDALDVDRFAMLLRAAGFNTRQVSVILEAAARATTLDARRTV